MAQKNQATMNRYCSFCGIQAQDVEMIVAGPDVCICNNCIMSCYEILQDHVENTTISKSQLKPVEIKKVFDQHIVGQESAKKKLAVALYNHKKRIKLNDIEKNNILLIGPTGTGKTLLAKTAASILDVPFIIVNATSFTEAGYVGQDVETILYQLVQASDFDIKKAETGIVYIDEFDKLARKSSHLHSRDASGEGVQQSLLKMLEDTEVQITTSQGFYKETLTVNTKNILFICGGSFEGLDKIVSHRLKQQTIGFKANQNIGLLTKPQIIPQDLIQYGIIPECVGRLPVVATLEPLTEQEMVDILTKPVNSLIKQYQKLFKMDNIGLMFTPKALKMIAQKAMAYHTGARALRTVLEDILLDPMYEAPSAGQSAKELIITPALINKQQIRAVI